MSPRVLAVAAFAIFAALARSQSLSDLFETAQFHSAFFDENNKEITFNPFQDGLNWEAKARSELKWLNFEKPASDQIARLSSFDPAGPTYRTIDFLTPLDPAVARSSYFLISATGVDRLEPVQLKGSVQLWFNEGLTEVRERHFSGVVVAKPARPAADAAFAVVARPGAVSDVRPGRTFSARKLPGSSGAVIYDFVEGGRTFSWTAGPQSLTAVESAMSFALSDRLFVLVKWKPFEHPAMCEFAYTLFSIDGNLQPIAGNAYGCDV